MLIAHASDGGPTTRDALADADYLAGRTAFQQRCSACHTLADGANHLIGPNLWGMFDRQVGELDDFQYSPALENAQFPWSPESLGRWLREPQSFLPDNRMAIPEPVPEHLIVPLLSFVMVETGAADWERPEIVEAPVDRSLPLSERFPSFYNHLMHNTTRYRMTSSEEEVVFDSYYQKDGSVTSSLPTVGGFWHVTAEDRFCYALYGLPVEPSYLVQCFPIAAMAIPRFAEELWRSPVSDTVTLVGGILPGRPSQSRPSATGEDE